MKYPPDNPLEAAPTTRALEKAIATLSRHSPLAGLRWLHVAAVGSWAEGCWQPGDDLDLRMTYVLPLDRYLSMGSYRDEIELVTRIQGSSLDIVAFEIEKAARLVLKGHQASARWIASLGELTDPTASTSNSCLQTVTPLWTASRQPDPLVQAARKALEQSPPQCERGRHLLSAAEFRVLDGWISRMRAGG